MKKLILIIMALLLLILNTGYRSATDPGYEQASEILRCFDEEDSEGLKSLFCEEIQNTHNLDEDIKNALDIYQGKTISYKIIGGTGGETDENGKIVLKDENIQIGEIKNDTGN